jgi:RNA polymerase subunit RPABC4/transcription elongation factor Spt4
MEFHSNQQFEIGKEIRCKDCSSVFRVKAEQKSGACPNCGNIQFTSGWNDLLNKVSEKASLKESAFDLSVFSKIPDGIKVEEILMNHQVEWQIWAALVKNFSDPLFHSAYLTHLLQTGTFSNGMNRYKEHRSIMALDVDTRWQADVSDFMLARIESLSESHMKMEGKSFSLAEWIQLLPLNTSPTFRVAWISLGIIGLWTLFRIF